MSCRGCGSGKPMTKSEVENFINKLMTDGDLQGGLQSCDGNSIPGKSKVVLCAELAGAVNALIEKNLIQLPELEPITYDPETGIMSFTLGKETEKVKIPKAPEITVEVQGGDVTVKKDNVVIANFKIGVTEVVETDDEYRVTLGDGRTNVRIPKHKATVRFLDAFGEEVAFAHKREEM